MPRPKKPKKPKKPKHPTQPIVWADDGVIRFKQNAIVRFLLDYATTRGYSLNEIVFSVATGEYTRDDYTQLMQLIGYSTSGLGELSRVDKSVVALADAEAERMVAARKRRKPHAK